MLTGDQMQIIDKNFLIKIEGCNCLFIVVERVADELILEPVNYKNPFRCSAYVDDLGLSLFDPDRLPRWFKELMEAA